MMSVRWDVGWNGVVGHLDLLETLICTQLFLELKPVMSSPPTASILCVITVGFRLAIILFFFALIQLYRILYRQFIARTVSVTQTKPLPTPSF